ncbi:MAG: hypothetical protein HY332_25635 [Chloroflexi bacterium]|nr:hypothetical protein [Chloroflexota bacterium]
MMVPESFALLWVAVAPCCTAPTYQTFCYLVAGGLHCPGRHTVTGVAVAAGVAGGDGTRGWRHSSVFHRFFSRARWEPDAIGKAVCTLARRLLPAGWPIILPVDDRLARKGGRRSPWARCTTTRCAPAGARRSPALAMSGSWWPSGGRSPLGWSAGHAGWPCPSCSGCSSAANRATAPLRRRGPRRGRGTRPRAKPSPPTRPSAPPSRRWPGRRSRWPPAGRPRWPRSGRSTSSATPPTSTRRR